MSLTQQFRLGNEIESLPLRKDANGTLYSQMDDILDIFPGALRFKVNGIGILFLQDEHGQRYEPKRILYHPGTIIDVVTAAPTLSPRGSLKSIDDESIDDDVVSVSALSLYSHISSTCQVTARHSLSPPSTTHVIAASPLDRPLAVLASIAANISHLQNQLDHSTDQQSVHHQQLLQQLCHMVQQQNAMLREQAASKEREEQMLREQAESKLREKQILAKQRESIDRLIVAQQRLEAILVQNYELHEYPIPRLFVILPDSYQRWDPRNFMAERFRLFFLCECGDHCNTRSGSIASSGQLTIAAATSSTPILVKNSIHLAKHEGYELSRPREFFDQYGPYVLGMLKILKHCLAVATVVAPAVALAENSLKDVIDSVKTISESTMEAIDISINFLEKKLDGDAVAEAVAGDDMFSGLAALEGADLRRLDSFLRNKDADKILGNLYRITTETGQVKWVCLEHYRQVYRETAMASFLQCVETNNGTYDPQLGEVVVSLNSSTAAKDFFSRLSTQAPAVTGLKVKLDWPFGSADLAILVGKVALSNVRELELDLDETTGLTPIASLIRLGKGRYHSLLSLFSNTKIKGLIFTNLNFIGPRTSNFPPNHSPSVLQKLYFAGPLNTADSSRVASIILLCPRLVELGLGSVTWISQDVSKVDKVIGSLSQLQVLRRYCLFDDIWAGDIKGDAVPYGSVALRELVDIGLPYPTGHNGLLEDAIRRSSRTLEVLITRRWVKTNPTLDLTHIRGLLSPCNAASSGPLPFARLTHLDLTTRMPTASVAMLEKIIPRLALIHFAVGANTFGLLSIVNLKYLISLHVQDIERTAMRPYWIDPTFSSASCCIESLRIDTTESAQDLLGALFALPLKRLYISKLGAPSMVAIFRQLNLRHLQVLSVLDPVYNWETEAVLAGRSSEFADGLVVHLGHKSKEILWGVYDANSRYRNGKPGRLPRQRIRIMRRGRLERDYFASVLPSFS